MAPILPNEDRKWKGSGGTRYDWQDGEGGWKASTKGTTQAEVLEARHVYSCDGPVKAVEE